MRFGHLKQDIKQDSCKTRTGTQKVIVKSLHPTPCFLFFMGEMKKYYVPSITF
jgi:hypothetical protein